MMEIPGTAARIPLVPLADDVAFPCTDVKLRVHDRGHLLRHVIERDRDGWVGLVLVKPSWGREAIESERPPIFPAGTAGRVIEVEILGEGRANLLVHGEYRFELTREVSGEPFRQALVRPLEEPRFDDSEAAIRAVRDGLVELARALAEEPSDPVPFPPAAIDALGSSPFEELVNRLAQGLDLPALRKLELLTESILDRALSILSILKSRKQATDLLRPYRHLAARSPLN